MIFTSRLSLKTLTLWILHTSREYLSSTQDTFCQFARKNCIKKFDHKPFNDIAKILDLFSWSEEKDSKQTGKLTELIKAHYRKETENKQKDFMNAWLSISGLTGESVLSTEGHVLQPFKEMGIHSATRAAEVAGYRDWSPAKFPQKPLPTTDICRMGRTPTSTAKTCAWVKNP